MELLSCFKSSENMQKKPTKLPNNQVCIAGSLFFYYFYLLIFFLLAYPNIWK